MTVEKSTTGSLVIFFTAVVVTGVLYFPALDSAFILDDRAGLEDLSEIPARGYSFYLLGSNAGPTGRPVSLLTFAVQSSAWPGNPFAFKSVNLALHVLNGCLIFFLACLLLQKSGIAAGHTKAFAAAVAALWLIHPIHAGTVLYVVQRMTLLSSTFILIAILVFILLADKTRQYATGKRLLFIAVPVYLITILAIYSKEIGILVPFYCLAIYFSLGIPRESGRGRLLVYTILGLPVLILAGYLVFGIDLSGGYRFRTFSMGERLMTQANVLIDYLYSIILPRPGIYTLFHDNYPVARGLFEPARTYFSILLILATVIFVVIKRSGHAVICFSVLWYLAGHVLESTVIGLELYFDHRNYLPSFGIILLVCWCLYRLFQRTNGSKFVPLVAGIYAVSTALVTASEMELWKNPYLQARQWYESSPDSRRALNYLWNMQLVYGKETGAKSSYETFIQLFPDDIFPLLKGKLIEYCYGYPGFTNHSWDHVYSRARESNLDRNSIISFYNELVNRLRSERCDRESPRYFLRVTQILASNPEFRPVKAELLGAAATIAYYANDLESALGHMKNAMKFKKSLGNRVFLAKLLYASGEKTELKKQLEIIEKQLAANPRANLFYRDQVNQLKR